MIRDNRLYSIVQLIDTKTRNLVDIGVDHGFLIKMAFDNNKIDSAIAADINEQPLNSARSNLENYPVKYILSDGFKNIKDYFDVAVIAGLGANTIIDIMKETPNKNALYLLQANNKVERLRKHLINNNYQIIDEVLVLENNRFYVILKVISGRQNLTDDELYLGPILKNKESSNQYYQHQLDHFYNLINNKNAKKSSFDKAIKILETQLSK